MPVPIIPQDASLASALEDVTFTSAALAAHPYTTALAPDFDAVYIPWTDVNNKEIQLRREVVKAQARISVADDTLDELVDAVSHGVLLEVKGKRDSSLYELYFKKAPGELKRPVLGGQLEALRGWAPSLQGSENPVLKDLGTRVAAAVQVADDAVKALASAEQDTRTFRTVGERKGFIDNLNALRKSTYGKLSEMPHADPSKQLPATFADGFFRHASRRAPAKATSQDLLAQIAEQKERLAALEAQLAQVTAAEEAAAKAKSEEEAHKAALAAAEKEAAAAAAKVAALKAKKK